MNEPLAKLETGRELDIAVAKEVLQWTQREKSWRTPGGRFRRRPWLVSWLVGDDYWLLSEVRRTWDPQRLKTFDAWLCVQWKFRGPLAIAQNYRPGDYARAALATVRKLKLPKNRSISQCNCCPHANEYNGFGSGERLFECPERCACHD
jgi:hypothetical protein